MRLSEVPDLVRSPGIRVWIAADQLLEANPLVSLELTDAESGARSIFPPWFFKGVDRVDFDEPSARPRSMAWVAANTVEGLLDQRVPHYPLALPSYAVPGGALCLDGNHRLLSAVRHRGNLPIAIVTIHGPLDAAILPDLAHWIRPSGAS